MVRCSVSHNDSWVYGEQRDWKTQSVSFQHMVNLVLNHRPCQVKSVQYHSTPFFMTISLSQIQSGATPCCCAETYLTADFHVFSLIPRVHPSPLLGEYLGNISFSEVLEKADGFCFCLRLDNSNDSGKSSIVCSRPGLSVLLYL